MAVVQPTVNVCEPFEGRPIRYQAEAAHRMWVETGRQPASWAWIETTCGTPCLNVDHMAMQAPRQLAYPSRVCIYCGRSAGTQDHLLPRQWSGETKRTYVVTVPACGTCNNALNDTLTWSITERRMICHYRLRRKFRKALEVVEYGPSDIAKFEGMLRDEVLDGMARKRVIDAMLAWPEHDPGYDLRACQKSGIEDPYAIGLIIPREEAARIAREVVGGATEDDHQERNVSAFGFRKHGQIGTYRLGCRCAPCKEARRLHAKRPQRKARVFDE